MKDTSGELTVTSKKTAEGQLLISVSDSGIGMGLSISRRILESHRSRLWAGANSGRGTIFQFTLPTG
jgi:signal transduction histidine kinase